MASILAVDAGSVRSAWLKLDRATEEVLGFGIDANEDLRDRLATGDVWADEIVFEWMTPRGLPTSAQEFETLYWIGRLSEAARGVVVRLARDKVKFHLTGRRSKVGDPQVAAALIDRYGGIGGRAAAVGVKAKPGPLYGVTRDVWAALAVAVTYLDDPSLVYVPKEGR